MHACRGELEHSAAARICFLRLNKWPMRSEACHELWARMAEEERFGGERVGPKRLVFTGGSMFIAESFVPCRRLLTLSEWKAERPAGEIQPMVFVLDMSGFFSIALNLRLQLPLPQHVSFRQ